MTDTPQLLAQKALGLMHAGQFNAAAKVAKQGLKKFPREAGFANLAGMALAQDRREREAIPFFQKALKVLPGDEDCQNNLVQALVMSAQHERAEALIAKLLPKRKQPAQLYYLRAMSMSQQGCPDDVVAATTNAIEHDPKHANAWNLRGIALTDLGREEEALSDFDTAHGLAPNDPDPLANKSVALERLFKTKDALEYAERALALNPKHYNALHHKALLFEQLGRNDEAKETRKLAFEINSNDVHALMAISLTNTPEENQQLLPKLKAVLSSNPKLSENAGYAHFALADNAHRIKDFPTAARHYDKGNAALSAHRPYVRQEAEQELDRIRNQWAMPAPENLGSNEGPTPVFVLGQPRSGTTLTEMIISAHPRVKSFGELPHLGRLVPKIIEAGEESQEFDPKSLEAHYRAKLDDLEGCDFFVDKMPANYRYIGYALAAFPQARIVHIDRDPREVALSMWRNSFSGAWMNFTYSLEGIAHSANLYRRFMQFWESEFDDRILTLKYHDIVTDVDAASRRMADFIGLDWVPEMARPDKNKAEVRTASIRQVREGVHRKSIGGWRAYEEALRPMTQALDPQLWPDLQD